MPTSNGGIGPWLAALARTYVLLLDDWGLAALDGQTRADLMEVIDDRAGTRPTIVSSQLPIEHWHAWIGDAKMTTALLDRLTHHCHIVETGNESYRFSHSTAVAKKRIKAREQARRADQQPLSEAAI